MPENKQEIHTESDDEDEAESDEGDDSSLLALALPFPEDVSEEEDSWLRFSCCFLRFFPSLPTISEQKGETLETMYFFMCFFVHFFFPLSESLQGT